MTTNIWEIVWRESATGNIVETVRVGYCSWEDADAALSTLHRFRKDLTPTIERRIVEA